MKGTIIYLTCYSVQNKELKPMVNTYHTSYFYNTNICYPSEKEILNMDKTFTYYENEKLYKDMNIIQYKIILNPICEEIYNNITNLLNNITFKQSILNLDELYRNNSYYFINENLFVKVYAILTRYKFKQSARKAILLYFEKCIYSSGIALKSSLLIKKLEKNILNAHDLE